MRYRFILVDVFTPSAFNGNQLAVVPAAAGISAEGMQAVAREFNFSETTFVTAPADAANSHRVRIFTPQAELPFAGHPTVGTACALVYGGHVAERRPLTLRFEEGVGVVRVDVTRRNEVLSATLTLTAAPERFDRQPPADLLAACLSLRGPDVLQGFQAGIGLSFCFVRLASRAAVDRAAADPQRWAELRAGGWAPQMFFFSGDLVDGAELYARMFAPGQGIVEDPATGSACAGLVAATAAGSGDGAFRLSVVQGVAMGRRSEIEAVASVAGGQVVSVSVGGPTAYIAEGEIEVPARHLRA
jgi:trans-2,3-dihydro-3-hydroxyanthranilate isomerase